jgi:hypothetical protein
MRFWGGELEKVARAFQPEQEHEGVCSGWKARATEVVWVGVLGLESPSYGSGVG